MRCEICNSDRGVKISFNNSLGREEAVCYNCRDSIRLASNDTIDVFMEEWSDTDVS